MLKKFFKNRRGAVGIGTLIIFIALVLVAAVAASVIINTAGKLQHKASIVGQQSTQQVASGIQVIKVIGYGSGNITKMAILASPNIGDEVDLSSTIVSLSNGDRKVSLVYSGYIEHVEDSGSKDIFNITGAWPLADNYPDPEFGLIVLQDADGSTNSTAHPTVNYGDKVIIAIDLTNSLGPIAERQKVFGEVIPEYGASGIIDFRAPSAFVDAVTVLQ